jgi:hypothetical protein
VNPGASFLRNLLRFADTFLFLCPIALVTMLASRGYRRLGDWAADTLVVYTPRSLSVSVRPALVSLARKGGAAGQGTPGAEADPGIEGRAALSTLSGEERQGILMFAGRYSLLGRARADEIAAPYVGVLREDAMRRIPDDVPQDNALPGAGERPPLSAADYLLALSRRLVGT